MGESTPRPGCRCAQMRHRIALNILLDEFAIATLSDAAALLREANDPTVTDLEHAIRTHRIGIIKQRAVLGAAGLDV